MTLQTSTNLSLPSTWSSLSQLASFNYGGVGGNPPKLTGSLPASWGTMTNLTAFEVDYADTLSGPLPDAWNGMRQLKSLVLVDCNISGTLPESWSNLTQLDQVAITNSQLTGTLQHCFWGGLALLICRQSYWQQPQRNSANGVEPL